MTSLTVLGSRDILGKTVTAFGTVENPLFLAKGMVEWIEYSGVSMMLKSIDDDDKTLIQTILVSGQQSRKYWFLSEAGLYEVLIISRLPIAKMFRKGLKQFLHDVRMGKDSYFQHPVGAGEFHPPPEVAGIWRIFWSSRKQRWYQT